MGYGDEIMAAAEARQVGGLVAIVGKNGKPRTHELWRGLDYIAKPEEFRRDTVPTNRDRQRPLEITPMVNGPGARPYVDYDKTTKTRWHYTNWRCRPGEIVFDENEHADATRIMDRFATPVVVVEPYVKASASPNKEWGFARMQAVVDNSPEYRFVQFDWSGRPILDGVKAVATPTFRVAAACLARADLYIGPEGGLHHAAAAVGSPAIVIFGGMTSPANTGYDMHTNLFVADEFDGIAGPCGWRVPCSHCRRAMDTIKPETVKYHLDSYLTAGRRAVPA